MKLNTMNQNASFPTSSTSASSPAKTNTQYAISAGPWLYGTIRSVEPSRELLFLHQPHEANEQIVHWLPHTRFRYHGTEVQADALHEGQQISVQYSSDGGLKFAVEIDIIVEPPAAESAAALRRSLWPSRSDKKTGQ